VRDLYFRDMPWTSLRPRVPADHRSAQQTESDLDSFHATLLHVLSGQPPFNFLPFNLNLNALFARAPAMDCSWSSPWAIG
jgi:hypothetical protein